MSAHADLPAGMLCPHVEACKVWPQAWKFQSGTWKEVRGIGVQCPNMHAEHREVYGSQGLLAPLMKSPRQRQAWGRGACLRNAGHTRLLLESVRAFLSLNQSSLPRQLCSWPWLVGILGREPCCGGHPSGWPGMQKCTLQSFWLQEVHVLLLRQLAPLRQGPSQAPMLQLPEA